MIAFFGATLLDTVYARAIRGVLDPAQAATVFSKASDFLLLVVALTALAAIGAIGGSWQSSLARNLLMASVLLVLSELLAPMVLRPLGETSSERVCVRVGFLGLRKFYLRS